MQPQSLSDHQKLLTEVIKKQIVILGPSITLAKARNVPGLTIQDDGTVTQITGDPKLATQQLIDQFMELSGLIVKKTMEPLLAMSNATNQTPASPASASTTSIPTQAATPHVPQPAQTIPIQIPTIPSPTMNTSTLMMGT